MTKATAFLLLGHVMPQQQIPGALIVVGALVGEKPFRRPSA